MLDETSLHRDSIAWQKGMQLAKAVYRSTQRFPPDERFGLTNQLRRASVSVPSNIAEGKGRSTTGELIQFLSVARGSTLEVQTQLELAADLGFGQPEELRTAYALASEVIKILNASLKTLKIKHAARSTKKSE